MFPVIFLVALTFVGPSFCSPVNPVFDLTDANFEHFLKDKDAMLVDFYAPWYVIIPWQVVFCSNRPLLNGRKKMKAKEFNPIVYITKGWFF